jgi:biopolymer transport protein ExbB
MEFDIVERLLAFTLLGSRWVLWLLLFLSTMSVGIMLERAIFFMRIRMNFHEFSLKLSELLSNKAIDQAQLYCAQHTSIEAHIALCGLKYKDKGPKAMEGLMEGFLVGEKHVLDRGLVVLGTLGNNAPFIGLFGTVIGIIEAFHALAQNPLGGPSVVMAGISEALVATAVGLVVAIPAVIAFNFFNRVVKKKIANAQATIKLVMSHT